MLFVAGWIFACAFWAIDLVWLKIGDFSVTVPTVAPLLVTVLAATTIILRKRHSRISASCHALVLSMISGSGLRVFYYLCATPGFPLVDSELSAADHALGFDWLWWYQLVSGHHFIFTCFGILYFFAWAAQTAALPVLLPVFNPNRSAEFVLLFGISLAMSTVGAMIWPSEGAIFYNLTDVNPIHVQLIDGLRDFTALRNGSLKNIDLNSINGIIAFPSFHTVTAILYAYAVRGSGRLFRIVVVLNAMMAVTIPIFGGHYLVDMIAGAVIAVTTIMIVRPLSYANAEPVTPKSVFNPQ